MSPLLLSLDLGKDTGFALLKRTTPPTPPRFGTVPLRGDNHAKLGAFSRWLPSFHSVAKFDAMAWEKPLLLPTDTVELLTLLIGLSGLCHAFSWDKGLPYMEVPVRSAKLTLAGDSFADKDAMIVASIKAGWACDDHHQADAGAVGVFAFPILYPESVTVR